MKTVILLAVLFCLAFSFEKHAVLIAGSSGWSNYRHQADLTHSYHLLMRNGFKPENVILIMKDDLANNSRNPFPGKIFNKPTGPGEEGWDFYEGINIDYSGRDATKENYINVLLGNKDKVKGGNGRVLESGPEDHVFLYYEDHGGNGLISMPDEKYLYKDELHKTLFEMQEKGMFAKLTFYLSACHSGSMWTGIPEDKQIYAAVSAHPNQSSYGQWCGSESKINGKLIGSCLGSQFSLAWLWFSEEIRDLSTLTLEEHFAEIKNRTTMSQALQYGDLSFQHYKTSDFIGKQKANFIRKLKETQKSFDMVAQKDIKLRTLMDLFKNDPSTENFEELQAEIQHEKFLNDKFESLENEFGVSNEAEIDTQMIDFDCYRNVIDRFEDKCAKLGDYGIQFTAVLAQLCYEGRNMTEELTLQKIEQLC